MLKGAAKGHPIKNISPAWIQLCRTTRSPGSDGGGYVIAGIVPLLLVGTSFSQLWVGTITLLQKLAKKSAAATATLSVAAIATPAPNSSLLIPALYYITRNSSSHSSSFSESH